MIDAFQLGDSVLIRSVNRDRVRWAVPHRFVGIDAGRLILYRAPGAQGKAMGRDHRGKYMDRWVSDTDPVDLTWHTTHVLQFVRPEDEQTVEVFWDASWMLLGWYVNLQTPLCATPLGFDTTDWALDVWVEPDGTWRWKDEDDFAEAIALGVFDDASAARVRAAGERAIALHQWPTGWEDWRPPADWEPLSLSPRWAAF
jgi:hypothetical protein